MGSVPRQARPALLGLAMVLLATGCARERLPELEAAPPPAVDFSGSWELDYRRSEDVQGKLQSLALLERRRARSAAPVTQRSRFGPVFLTGSGAFGSQFRYLVELARLAAEVGDSKVLTIVQDAASIDVVRDDDFTLQCHFHGGLSEPDLDALGAEICGWDEEQLVFSMQLPDGLSIAHRLTLARDGQSLNVATTVSTRGVDTPFTLHRVYQRFEPLADEYACEYTVENGKTCWAPRPGS